tara:strand:- start:2170 stop:2985 length:816 start_codon:yes stop_codon:yes gene_type:complete
MSTQKNKINNPKLAKRSLNSILAEVFLCKKMGWKVEFLSSGYGFDIKKLVNIVKNVKRIYKEKIWLNVGALDKEAILKLKPYIKGVYGAIETINEDIRKEVCPSKKIEQILDMFSYASDLKKGITIIIGLGETEKDINKLNNFIEEHKIDQITFYALNPHKETIFNKGPNKFYYAKWIAKTRIKFPKLKIITGTWVNRVEEINLLLKAGANAITKFPIIKLFNSSYAKVLEDEIIKSKRNLIGSFTKIPKIENKLNKKVEEYIEVMEKSKK